MNKVEKQFLSRAYFKKGSAPLYKITDTIDFINECKRENIAVLGLDGFYLIEDKTKGEAIFQPQPSLVDSIDFTNNANKGKANIHDIAVEFVRSRYDKSLFFEIVT